MDTAFNEGFVSRRSSVQAKQTAAGGKVSFAETPADGGQNKENDQPVAEPGNDNCPVAQSESVPAPQQQSYNNAKDPDTDDDGDDGHAKIIPWRAQLRKTNSTLNLLE